MTTMIALRTAARMNINTSQLNVAMIFVAMTPEGVRDREQKQRVEPSWFCTTSFMKSAITQRFETFF